MAFPRIEGYVVTEKLGFGSYSTVYKAYNKVGGRQTVAIKCVDKSRVKHSGAAVDNLVTEIRLLKTLVHPHIVRMHHFTWDDKNIYIVMEYCSGGDLSRYIKRYGRVPEPQVRYFLQQLAAALKYLHENGVAHMDLKPHNLLLQREGARLTLKLADFGFAQLLPQAGGVRGSPLYMAPELLAGRGGATADLWSVGVIMYECLFGAAPYSSSTLQELLDKIQREQEIQLPPRPPLPPACRALLGALLQHAPAARLSHARFFEHEYLDLQHMPSPDNYEKAVSLIKRAVSLDASGDWERAFAAYRDSLRYLVPCAAAERDAVRRAALRGKLGSYMERAEELKLFLAGNSGGGGGGGGGGTHAEMVPAPTPPSTKPTPPSPKPAPPSTKHTPPSTGPKSLSTEPTPPSSERAPPSTEPAPPSGAPPPDKPRRWALRRLFGRSLPLLDSSDSSLTNETNQDNQKENEDACRIS